MSNPRTLTFQVKFQVLEWVRDKTEWILEKKPTMQELADHISKELNVRPFSARVMGEICHTIGLSWESTAPGAATNARTLAATRHLEEKLRKQEEELEQFRKQAAATDAIYSEFQSQVDASLARMSADIATLRGLVHELYRHTKAIPIPGYEIPARNYDHRATRVIPDGNNKP
jgi:hypothetical protein